MQGVRLTPERNGLTVRNGRTDPRPTTLKRPTRSGQRRAGIKPVARKRSASNRRRNAILHVICWIHLRCPTEGFRRSTGQPPRRSRTSSVRAAIQPARTTQCFAINSPTPSRIPRRLCVRLSRCPPSFASKWWTARGQRRASRTSACRRSCDQRPISGIAIWFGIFVSRVLRLAPTLTKVAHQPLATLKVWKTAHALLLARRKGRLQAKRRLDTSGRPPRPQRQTRTGPARQTKPTNSHHPSSRNQRASQSTAPPSTFFSTACVARSRASGERARRPGSHPTHR